MYITERDEVQMEHMRASGKYPCPDFERVSHQMVCNLCNQQYVDHPRHVPWMFLTCLCDGRIVKL